MPSIELSTDTYAALQALAKPFEDTPETVIRRLLDGTGSAAPSATEPAAVALRHSGRRAPPGTILPERAYWEPILKVLVSFGGAAPAQEVIDRVGEELADHLTPRDYEALETGEVRFRKRTQFARFRMKERGLLASDSARGIWEITDEGRRYLKGVSDARARDDGFR